MNLRRSPPNTRSARVTLVATVATVPRVAAMSDKVLCDFALCLGLERKNAALRPLRNPGTSRMSRFCIMMAHDIVVVCTRDNHPHALAIRAKADAEGGDYGRAFARYLAAARTDAEDLASVGNVHLLPFEEALVEFRQHVVQNLDADGIEFMRRYNTWLELRYTAMAAHLQDPGFQRWRRLMQDVAAP